MTTSLFVTDDIRWRAADHGDRAGAYVTVEGVYGITLHFDNVEQIDRLVAALHQSRDIIDMQPDEPDADEVHS